MKRLFFVVWFFLLCGIVSSQIKNVRVSSGLESQIKNVRVSSGLESQPNEVSISINPANPNQIAAGSNLKYLYLSTNKGLSWQTKELSSSLGVWGDPCVLYNNLGMLFYGHLSNPSKVVGYWIDRIVVQRSVDNGITWDYDVGVGYAPPKKMQDKEWVTADITHSVYSNNLYMAWTEFDSYGTALATDSTRILFSASVDNGATWRKPIRISTIGGNCLDDDETVEGCVPAVGPNGEVYLSWSGPAGLMFDKSTDGGFTFGSDVKVASLSAGWKFDVPGIMRCNGMPVTACDISNSPYKGTIYINWSDQINGDTEILFSKSTNGGKTWSAPKLVNNDNSGRHQFFTWMSVDPKSGYIYIVFYDRRHNSSPLDLATHVYLARSTDGGQTFQNYKISETSFIPDQSVFFGDYTGIASYDGFITPIWMRCDNRALSVWTALINDSQLITDIKDDSLLPQAFSLFQNYPNPFNPSTTISYQIKEAGFVTLKVYDALGREISTLVNKMQQPGTYYSTFSPSVINSHSSGIYYYSLTAGKNHQTNKMVLIK